LVGAVAMGPVPPPLVDRKHDRPSALQVKPGAQMTRQLLRGSRHGAAVRRDDKAPLVVLGMGNGPATGGRGAGAATTGADRGMAPPSVTTKRRRYSARGSAVSTAATGHRRTPLTRCFRIGCRQRKEQSSAPLSDDDPPKCAGLSLRVHMDEPTPSIERRTAPIFYAPTVGGG
jgi:hypothetical protein